MPVENRNYEIDTAKAKVNGNNTDGPSRIHFAKIRSRNVRKPRTVNQLNFGVTCPPILIFNSNSSPLQTFSDMKKRKILILYEYQVSYFRDSLFVNSKFYKTENFFIITILLTH